MKFLTALVLAALLVFAGSAQAVPPNAPKISVKLAPCAFDARGLYEEVLPNSVDLPNIKKFRMYRDGILHLDRTWIPNGVNQVVYRPMPDSWIGTTQEFYGTVVNFADEESPVSPSIFLTMTACSNRADAIDDLNVIALGCDATHLQWTPTTSSAQAYRIGREKAADLWKLLPVQTPWRMPWYAFNATDVNMTGTPLPLYQDPPLGPPLSWMHDYNDPLVPGEEYCYAVQTWTSYYSLSWQSNIACVTLPLCP